MEMSFFALPSKQGPVQGRFKPAHRPISLSTKVAACVRRFETPIALNHGRTESKKDISMLTMPFLSCVALKCHGQMLKCYVKAGMQNDADPIMQALLNHTNEFKTPAILLCNQIT
jgi:hypothetical protein